MVTGSVTMPASDRLTRSTWWAWSSIERLRCRTPMPPSRAIAMAIRASVTVSIAAETSGTAHADLAGQPGGGVHLGRDDVGLAGQEQDVVEGQRQRGQRAVSSAASSSRRRGSSHGSCYRRLVARPGRRRQRVAALPARSCRPSTPRRSRSRRRGRATAAGAAAAGRGGRWAWRSGRSRARRCAARLRPGRRCRWPAPASSVRLGAGVLVAPGSGVLVLLARGVLVWWAPRCASPRSPTSAAGRAPRSGRWPGRWPPRARRSGPRWRCVHRSSGRSIEARSSRSPARVASAPARSPCAIWARVPPACGSWSRPGRRATAGRGAGGAAAAVDGRHDPLVRRERVTGHGRSDAADGQRGADHHRDRGGPQAVSTARSGQHVRRPHRPGRRRARHERWRLAASSSASSPSSTSAANEASSARTASPSRTAARRPAGRAARRRGRPRRGPRRRLDPARA